jgi:ABC-type uncharacterized transport system permease subunit
MTNDLATGPATGPANGPATSPATSLASSVRTLPQNDLKEAARAALEGLPPADRAAVVSAYFPQPRSRTADRIWLIVVCAFAVVLLGSFATLAVSVFTPVAEGGTSGQTILAVFTSVVGFLAGLFTPSPASGAGGGGTGG